MNARRIWIHSVDSIQSEDTFVPTALSSNDVTNWYQNPVFDEPSQGSAERFVFIYSVVDALRSHALELNYAPR